ncbi:MAG: NnrS family protein [Pseudomonadota bacterium]
MSSGQDLSLRRLGAAPHRLLFCIGASNLLLAMLWWALWLAAQRWPLLTMPQPALHPGWLHAYVMQYQMLPSFIFGFLLTVFPRWMNLPELPRWRYLPVGLGLFGGQIVTLLGALGWETGFLAGWLMTTAGWIAALGTLGPLLWRENGATWHARSCFAALTLGLVGLLAQGVYLLGAPPAWVLASITLGTFGLLLPVYLTVAHRMFPFFAGSAVLGYTPWRPFWLLVLFWMLCLAHVAIDLMHGLRWLWVIDLPLFALAAMVCWRWWPGSSSNRSAQTPERQPALLTLLFIGLGWLPVAFALYSVQSLAYLLASEIWLGRAPAHALFIGFFGSVLIAMVTRVTQGHSGNRLVLPPVAGFAFAAIQIVTLMRIGAELAPDAAKWQALGALAWLVALGPWVVWLGRTFLSARVDGKAG